MKAVFYLWCIMAVCGLIASFFNPSHLYFSCIPSVLLACVTYPDTKEEEGYGKK